MQSAARFARKCVGQLAFAGFTVVVAVLLTELGRGS